MNEWHEILEHLKAWTKEAGEALINGLERKLEVTEKSSTIDLVTEMDLWTEEFLLKKINEHYPTHAVLTEETGVVEGAADYQWVIDPIDGTTNYAHAFPMFCISVGVKYHGETVVGLVYAPKLGEMYTAVKGEGAFLNEKRITVSSCKSLRKAVVATGFPYDRAEDKQNNVTEFSNVVTKVAGIRRTGSAAIDLCQVAAGRFDGYWEYKLNPWDFTAGILLIEEAGGKTFVEPQEKGNFVIVGNEAIFAELSNLVKKDV